VRIVIDGRMLGWTGIGRYTSHVLQELAALDADTHYVVLVRRDGMQSWTPPGPNFDAVVADFAPYGWSEQARLPRQVRNLRPDLVHFTHFNAPFAYREDFAVTVYDTTMLRFPSHCDTSAVRALARAPKRALARRVMDSAVSRARTVFTLSRHTANELTETFGVDPDRIRVTYAAADKSGDLEESVPDVDGRDPFILYVGNAYPHKNLDLVIEAMRGLVRQHHDLRLVLAGPDDECSALLRAKVGASPLNDHIVFVGRVSDPQLTWLYRHGTLFVMPSLSEGFGLTGLEAMAYGLPVVAARASCLPEIYGDAAAYFEPSDPVDLQKALSGLLDDQDHRQRLVNAGAERTAGYSWRSVAQTTLAGYRQSND
jgi:glycosyltransferase involved in cell wall biosynthesis